MPQNLIIIKLGGSLITEKDKAYTLREGYLDSFARELKEILEAFPNKKFILLNGAGSFGHQTVVKYGIKNGFVDKKSRLGYARVLQDTAKLNRYLVDALLGQDIPAIQFQPSVVFQAIAVANFNSQKNLKSAVISTAGRNLMEMFYKADLKISRKAQDDSKNSAIDFKKVGITEYNAPKLDILEGFLDKDILPCLYGEMILDENSGCGVLSADKIPYLLAKYFENSEKYKIEKVINIGNYDGVLDDQKKVIPKITIESYPQIEKNLFESENVDASGGMKQKILEFLELTNFKISSVILNGLVGNNLKKYLKNEFVVKTEINGI